MLLSCFLSSRSNDGDLNNQVAAILHLGNISFVEAGNEVVIAVLILGFVLCHHYSRQHCTIIIIVLDSSTKNHQTPRLHLPRSTFPGVTSGGRGGGYFAIQHMS